MRTVVLISILCLLTSSCSYENSKGEERIEFLPDVKKTYKYIKESLEHKIKYIVQYD